MDRIRIDKAGGYIYEIDRAMNVLLTAKQIAVNMVVHRDYRDSSASIIKYFDNRIEFYNPGKLYGGITVADLLSGNYVSKSRNKLIAKAFKEVGMIERYGSGIIRIRKVCKEYGIQEPDFNEVVNGFQVILYNERMDDMNNIAVVSEKVSDSISKITDEALNFTEKVTENQRKILEKMDENPMISSEDLSSILGISLRKTKEYIAKLKVKGLIERIGPDKGGYWKIKNEIR